jgi:hypothetical protein
MREDLQRMAVAEGFSDERSVACAALFFCGVWRYRFEGPAIGFQDAKIVL